jgi:hypothetical protein
MQAALHPPIPVFFSVLQLVTASMPTAAGR